MAINFDDGIRFEILPVFSNKDDSFTFADSNNGGSWKVCDPKKEMAAFSTRNTEANGNLKALCRMMRLWKLQNSVPISGMLIDTLAYAFIATWEHRDKSFLYHDWLVRDFFLYMANQNSAQTYWRAPGSGSYVHSQGNFRTKAAAAYADAVRAINYGTNGHDWSYRETWRAIFGPTFP